MTNVDRIKPVSLDTPAQFATRHVAPVTTNAVTTMHNSWLWIIALVVITLIAAVFFWLPGQVNRASARLINEAATVPAQVNISKDRSQPISPWQQAQWAKQRKAAQQDLGKLLALQTQLEQIAVAQWAPQAFKQALAMAQQGDELYRNKHYTQAAQHYQRGAQQMQALSTQATEVFRTALQQAFKHLKNNQAGPAINAFTLALAIRPDDPDASQGLYRARQIEPILALKAKAEQLAQNQQLEQSLLIYQQARQLDPQSTLVLEDITSVTANIKQRDFNLAMASGYTALQHKQFKQARQQFNAALTLTSDAKKTQEVQSALQEAANQQTLHRIARWHQIAKNHESNENWQQAVAAYQAILTIDATLDFARQGLTYSKQRLALDKTLSATIEQPQRLASARVYQHAQRLYQQAATTERAGTRLIQQRKTLATLLKQAMTPVNIVLHSDDLTDVTVYRIAHLGHFTEHTLSLTPGTYTIVGSRDGYRDVRHEFQVVLEQPLAPIVIQCREKI